MLERQFDLRTKSTIAVTILNVLFLLPIKFASFPL